MECLAFAGHFFVDEKPPVIIGHDLCVPADRHR